MVFVFNWQIQIKETQKAIKHALTERWYAWEDARKLAAADPEIEYTDDGAVLYTPTIEEVDQSFQLVTYG